MNFEKVVLPVEAQLFPVLSVVSEDLNADGYDDLFLGGNIYETEVETPRLDAHSGLILISDKKGGYKPVLPYKSGIYFKGNIKAIGTMNTGKDPLLFALTNNGNLQLYRRQE